MEMRQLTLGILQHFARQSSPQEVQHQGQFQGQGQSQNCGQPQGAPQSPGLSQENLPSWLKEFMASEEAVANIHKLETEGIEGFVT